MSFPFIKKRDRVDNNDTISQKKDEYLEMLLILFQRFAPLMTPRSEPRMKSIT